MFSFTTTSSIPSRRCALSMTMIILPSEPSETTSKASWRESTSFPTSSDNAFRLRTFPVGLQENIIWSRSLQNPDTNTVFPTPLLPPMRMMFIVSHSSWSSSSSSVLPIRSGDIIIVIHELLFEYDSPYNLGQLYIWDIDSPNHL